MNKSRGTEQYILKGISMLAVGLIPRMKYEKQSWNVRERDEKRMHLTYDPME